MFSRLYRKHSEFFKQLLGFAIILIVIVGFAQYRNIIGFIWPDHSKNSRPFDLYTDMELLKKDLLRTMLFPSYFPPDYESGEESDYSITYTLAADRTPPSGKRSQEGYRLNFYNSDDNFMSLSIIGHRIHTGYTLWFTSNDYAIIEDNTFYIHDKDITIHRMLVEFKHAVVNGAATSTYDYAAIFTNGNYQYTIVFQKLNADDLQKSFHEEEVIKIINSMLW